MIQFEKNADFHYNAGLRPKIIRTAVGKTCKWCQSMAGVYDYSKVSNTGNNVFRRHANCDCTVVYDPEMAVRKYRMFGVKELIIEKILGQIQILWVQRNHSI